jgi:hypothetical protein
MNSFFVLKNVVSILVSSSLAPEISLIMIVLQEDSRLRHKSYSYGMNSGVIKENRQGFFSEVITIYLKCFSGM